MPFLKPLSGWIFILSGLLLFVPLVTSFKRFFSTRSFRSLSWTLSFFTLFSAMILFGLSRLQLNIQFSLIASIFIFFFVCSGLWILFVGNNLWTKEQRVFSFILSVLPWVFFATLFPSINPQSYPNPNLYFSIWSALSTSIFFLTWLLSFVASRLKKLDMNMSISALPLSIGCWLFVFNQTPAGLLMVSILFLSGISLMTYTWVNYGQKTD